MRTTAYIRHSVLLTAAKATGSPRGAGGGGGGLGVCLHTQSHGGVGFGPFDRLGHVPSPMSHVGMLGVGNSPFAKRQVRVDSRYWPVA
jgi:hypothetical protein